jgi:hypothetical protein
LGSAKLESNHGTAHAVASHGQAAKAALTLDDIVREAALETIRLLKFDVMASTTTCSTQRSTSCAAKRRYCFSSAT